MATTRTLVFTSSAVTEEAKDADTQITSGTMKNNSGSYIIDAAETSLIFQVGGSTLLTVAPAAVEVRTAVLPDQDEAYGLGSMIKKFLELWVFTVYCTTYDAGEYTMSFAAKNANSNTSTAFSFGTDLGDTIAVSNQGIISHKFGADLTSASTITPNCAIHRVTGTSAINTITKPDIFGGVGGQVTLIPTEIFTWTASGNIGLAGTAVVGKAIIFTWDPNANKWYPSSTS